MVQFPFLYSQVWVDPSESHPPSQAKSPPTRTRAPRVGDQTRAASARPSGTVRGARGDQVPFAHDQVALAVSPYQLSWVPP